MKSLVVLLLASLAFSQPLNFIPLCDPLIEGFGKGSCLRVEVINDPRYEGDMGSCVCRFIIRQEVTGIGELYLYHLRSCAFGEATQVSMHKNDCNETVQSPTVKYAAKNYDLRRSSLGRRAFIE